MKVDLLYGTGSILHDRNLVSHPLFLQRGGRGFRGGGKIFTDKILRGKISYSTPVPLDG